MLPTPRATIRGVGVYLWEVTTPLEMMRTPERIEEGTKIWVP
jgi:hypothetical protein